MGPLIGKLAPNFNTDAAINGAIESDISLQTYEGKYILLFFYPLDFTFVCPTELHAFQEALPEFEKRNCQVIGCSVDSVFSHLAWINTPKSKGGIQGVTYPILADLNKDIAKSYQVLLEESGIAFRGLFLIDQEGIIRHQVVNDLPLGRSVAEAIRMLDALIFFEKNGEVCPANWKQGDEGMTPTSKGLETFFTE